MIKSCAVIVLAVLAAVMGHFYMASNAQSSKRLLAESVAEAVKIENAYEAWKSKFGRLYGAPIENSFRKEIFAENYKLVEQTNSKNLKYKLALNQMADLTDEEFRVKYQGLGHRRDSLQSMRILQETHSDEIQYATLEDFNYDPLNEPLFKDWDMEGSLVAPVHQRGCGGCYAFSATSALEHAHYLKTRQLIKLSEQELIDCSKGKGNSGCRGGWTHQAFDYVLQNGGIQRSSTYPYSASEGYMCRMAKSLNVKNIIKGYKKIPVNKQQIVKAALQKTVISSAVDSSFLKLYSSGVYDNQACSTIINHAVVIVGYGMEDDGTLFWKIRNSWGSSWGEDGYFKILRSDDDSDGLCGITKYLVVADF